MFRKLNEEYHKWGCTINFDKAEYLCVGGEIKNMQPEEGSIVKACDEFVYLGTINNIGRCDGMIDRGIKSTRKITEALNSILWRINITTKTKMRIYDTIVKSTLTYSAEVWQIKKTMEQKLLATEMDFSRRSASIVKLERIRNEETTKNENTLRQT